VDQSWTLSTVFSALRKPVPESLPQVAISAVQTNPRNCGPGDLFVTGIFELNHLGYSRQSQAVQEAMGNGASAIMTSLSGLSTPPSVFVFQVDSTGRAMAALARFARTQFEGKVIAITGSVGKTSTKDVVDHTLSQFGTSFKTVNNHNSLFGVCRTIVNAPRRADFAVVEVGASSPGHLQHAKLANADIGIVTRIGISPHLVHYKDHGEVRREKLSLFDHLAGLKIGITHESVVAIDRKTDGLLAGKRLSHLITVGQSDRNDVYCSENRFNGVMNEGVMRVFGSAYPFQLNLPAPHFLDSAMFAAATAAALNLDISKALTALSTATITERRFERFRITLASGNLELIDDSYSSGPDAIQALLKALSYRRVSRKVFVWGDLAGLGDQASYFHSAIANSLQRNGVDLVLTVGELTRAACHNLDMPDVRHFTDRHELTAVLEQCILAGDLVAVKGSGSTQLGEVADGIKQLGICAPANSWRVEDDRKK